MPLVVQKNVSDDAVLGIWKIEEDEDYFLAKFNLTDFDRREIERTKAPAKLLQWLSSRYLLKHLMDRDSIIHLLKDDYGKPFVRDFDGHISISHCDDHVAVILSHRLRAGIDIEKYDNRIERISHRFLKKWERHMLEDDEQKFNKLVLYWSAKETLYKWYGKKGLTFKTQLLIDPFDLKKEGALKARLEKEDLYCEFEVPYFSMDEFILTYTLRPAPVALLKDYGTQDLG